MGAGICLFFRWENRIYTISELISWLDVRGESAMHFSLITFVQTQFPTALLHNF
jgi:hypothetical protein